MPVQGPVPQVPQDCPGKRSTATDPVAGGQAQRRPTENDARQRPGRSPVQCVVDRWARARFARLAHPTCWASSSTYEILRTETASTVDKFSSAVSTSPAVASDSLVTPSFPHSTPDSASRADLTSVADAFQATLEVVWPL